MSTKGQEWVLLDTETTGIIDPIYILEIYGQKMKGLTPVGNPLHLFINHKIPIPPEATAIHGYTNSFISKVGIDPKTAHKIIEEYCSGSPICSHNLGYDWCRCLVPERRRLGREASLHKGFCTLQLFRRTLDYQENYKLTHLKDIYSIKHPENCPSHSAKGDVLTVLEILKQKVFPLLKDHKITTIDEIKNLSKITPISLCRKNLGLNSPYTTQTINKPVEQIILETLAATLDLTEVEDSKIRELDAWLSLKNPKPKDLNKEIRKIVAQGIIDPDQRFEILEMIQPLLPLKERATSKQLSYLRRLSSDFDENLSKKEASRLIDKLKSNPKRYTITNGQVNIE